MKVFRSLKDGLINSVSSWKVVITIWFISLLLVSLIALPAKSLVQTGLGNSMITENLKEGFSFEVFNDLDSALEGLAAFISKGMLMIFLTGFLINSFLTGGLFSHLNKQSSEISVGDFFKASAKYFWSFAAISLIINLIIFLLGIIVILIPVAIVYDLDSASDVNIFTIGTIGTSVFIFILIITLLVADYARAWQVTQESNSCFRALGFGIKQTFRTFFSSYTLMLIILFVQAAYILFAVSIMPALKPQSGGGILMLFLFSQLLFFIRLHLKAWRYGSVTRLMDLQDHIGVEKDIF